MNLGEIARLSEELAKEGEYKAAIETLMRLTHVIQSPKIFITLSSMYRQICDIPNALAALDQAMVLEPSDALALRRALLLPPMMTSRQQIIGDRKRIQLGLENLLDSGIQIQDPLKELSNPDFYLVYHGENDLYLRQLLNHVLRPSLSYTAEFCKHWRLPTNRRFRIGFISSFFCSHTIGRLNRELLRRLPKNSFETFVFFAEGVKDGFAKAIQDSGDHSIVLPYDLQAARSAIEQRELDLLYFTDIGMAPFTYFLAFSRLAPVQCVTWGHPVTTGLDTMDYFVTSPCLEAEGSQDQYSEKLAMLSDPTVCYPLPNEERPENPQEFLGIPWDAHSYLCPQNLFKLHPDFDPALTEILRKDPKAMLLFQAPQNPVWKEILMKRLSALYPTCSERIVFLDTVPREAFLRRMAAADVILDPFHFGGGNTSLEALAMGTPIVTLPSGFLRCRLTLAWYKVLGFDACVAKSPEEYVNIAVKLANQPDFRAACSRIILQNLPKLFLNQEAVTSHEQFFLRAILEAEKSKQTALAVN